ncbi:MAG: site-2 protease family protein [Rhodomicrobium sp.]
MIKALLLLFSALKFGKILTVGGTMALSVLAYSLVWGWRYAAGFVALIFVHEMGHYLAAKQKGLNVGVPTFIPFVGAWIELKDRPMNAETEAYIGYAGPLVGTIGALACYFYARYTGERLFLALAYAGFFINLFNLIPLSPLDGGRITAVLSPRVWLLGVPLLIGLFFWRPSPLLILVAVFAAPQVFKALRYDATAPENQAYYSTSLETKITYGFYYLGLLAFLAIMCFDLHEMLGGS